MKSSILSATLPLILLLCACGKETETTPIAPPPIDVKAVKAVKSDVPIVREFVGQTVGSVDAEIRSRVQGVVTSINFDEGKPVKKDQVLYTIDPAPYKAKVAEAQGKLAEAQTKLARAESDLKRIKPLVEMKAMSERDLDAAVAHEGAARGALDAAKAALESANIELSYCTITSPVDGTIGLSKVKVGEYVGTAITVLNTVSTLDPIHVRFTVIEKDYLYFARLRQKELDAGSAGPKKRTLQLILADGSVHSQTGEIASIDRNVDATTGSLLMEAAFPNPGQILRPGQFAKIRSETEVQKGVVLVPNNAIRELQGQFQVFVVKPDNTVEIRTVSLGAAAGDRRVIESGINENDLVVVEGQQRLKGGSAVNAQVEG